MIDALDSFDAVLETGAAMGPGKLFGNVIFLSPHRSEQHHRGGPRFGLNLDFFRKGLSDESLDLVESLIVQMGNEPKEIEEAVVIDFPFTVNKIGPLNEQNPRCLSRLNFDVLTRF